MNGCRVDIALAIVLLAVLLVAVVLWRQHAKRNESSEGLCARGCPDNPQSPQKCGGAALRIGDVPGCSSPGCGLLPGAPAQLWGRPDLRAGEAPLYTGADADRRAWAAWYEALADNRYVSGTPGLPPPFRREIAPRSPTLEPACSVSGRCPSASQSRIGMCAAGAPRLRGGPGHAGCRCGDGCLCPKTCGCPGDCSCLKICKCFGGCTCPGAGGSCGAAGCADPRACQACTGPRGWYNHIVYATQATAASMERMKYPGLADARPYDDGIPPQWRIPEVPVTWSARDALAPAQSGGAGAAGCGDTPSYGSGAGGGYPHAYYGDFYGPLGPTVDEVYQGQIYHRHTPDHQPLVG